MFKFDVIDKYIVDLLQEDGRISCMEIGRRLGITERAARYRLNKLIEDGVIQIVAVVNPRKLGYNVNADVFLEVEADYIQDVAQKMTEYEEISYVAYSIGERDVSLQIYAQNTDEIYRLVTDVIGKTPGVRKTITSIVPKVIKDVHQWQIPLSVCNITKGKKNRQKTITD